jgi:3-deoxy-manno-octulosonate cytidylyltransferase (CMP-KDO synthetase)
VLLDIAGKPMVVWVVERALAAKNVDRVIVATDDEQVRDAVEAVGYEVAMTAGDHLSGTDRLAEVAARLPDAKIIVNVQGDEPLIAPQTIERAVDALLDAEASVGMTTTWERIESASDVLDPNVVKIVVDRDGRAIYFSRSPIPHPGDAVRRFGSIEVALQKEPELLTHFKKHTGLYVYRKELLLEFSRWKPSNLERIERLEQLRALENGVTIKAVEAATMSMGVDTPEDLQRVRNMAPFLVTTSAVQR